VHGSCGPRLGGDVWVCHGPAASSRWWLAVVHTVRSYGAQDLTAAALKSRVDGGGAHHGCG
jgi:hypothetical protein